MANKKKVILKRTGADAQQAGSAESFKKQRDTAFKRMLEALKSNDKKEYKKQQEIYSRLSAGYSAAKDDTEMEKLEKTILKNRKRFSKDYRKGGMVLSTQDNRKKSNAI